MSNISYGSTVSWQEGNCRISGKIKEFFNVKVMKNIKGDQVTRAGSSNDPAILIERENGEKYLKLKSEIYMESPSGTYQPKSSSATSPSSPVK